MAPVSKIDLGVEMIPFWRERSKFGWIVAICTWDGLVLECITGGALLEGRQKGQKASLLL